MSLSFAPPPAARSRSAEPPAPSGSADASGPAASAAGPGVLGAPVPQDLDLRRGEPGDRERVAAAARRLALAAPATGSPAAGSLAQTWQQLAVWGRADLVLGRLAEGHLDAAGILAEAGRHPVDDAFYGVWASASGGTGVRATATEDGWQLTGSLRFCTGARSLDRALITARTEAGDLLLLDVSLREGGFRPVEGTWPAVGMDLSDSLDVEADATVPGSAVVGEPGFYLNRPGFALGGIGVAAVWLGGTAGVLDTIADGLRRFDPDPHQLAHLGAMGTAVLGAADVLDRAAAAAPELPATELPGLALRVRSTAEEAARVVLDRAARLTGPTPLCRDAAFAHRMADLMVYVRQHHAERDLAALGQGLLADGPFGH